MLKILEWEGLEWTWVEESDPTPEKPCNGCENPPDGPLQVFKSAAGNEARWCAICVDLVQMEPENRKRTDK